MPSSQFQLHPATEPVVYCTLEQIARDGARRALLKEIEDMVPWLYLKGIRTGQMPDWGCTWVAFGRGGCRDYFDATFSSIC